ncbi:MAG: hypothetical protein DSY55_02175 [Clostridia bacterium]|nr:MAG: hypothetical protein DSY55_02175 [Clostridia bacterium]
MAGALLLAAGIAIAGQWLTIQVALVDWQQKALQLAIILLPSLLWLALFALFVRKDAVVRRAAFLLWLVTGAVWLVTVHLLLLNVFQIDQWLTVTWWSGVIGDLLVIAPLEIFLIYLALRLGVYPTSAFSRRTDGPLYGAAAGLGIATIILAVQTLATTPDLGRLILQTNELFLGYATLGGWMGYFLGQSRFKHTPGFFLAAGFLLTVIFHAFYFFALSAIVAWAPVIPSLIPLARLGFAALFALLNFLFIYWRVRVANKDFQHMADLIDESEGNAAARSKSLLEDVVKMVETNQLKVTHNPSLPPSTPLTEGGDSGDAMAKLKEDWDALVSEQEARQ